MALSYSKCGRLRKTEEVAAGINSGADRLTPEAPPQPIDLGQLQATSCNRWLTIPRRRQQDNLGTLLANTNQVKETLALFEAARVERVRLTEQEPEVSTHRHDLAGAYSNLVFFLRTIWRLEEAESANKEASRIREELAKRPQATSAYELEHVRLLLKGPIVKLAVGSIWSCGR
jgi:hypothetical protein